MTAEIAETHESAESWEPRVVLAPNPGPMTLEGTNTIVLAPGDEPAIVIDPGPADDSHLDAILAACPQGVAEVWVTHHHWDHLEAAAPFAARVGAPWRTFDPELGCDEPLRDQETRMIGGRRLGVHHLPGHTADSTGFVLSGPGRAYLLSGDMVLGRGTTVIMHPDGDLGAYLDSLDRMLQLVADHGIAEILPGHGPVVTEPEAWLRHYREHRLERLDQVRRALAGGASTPARVVDEVYGDLPEGVRRAAEASAATQLAYLTQE